MLGPLCSAGTVWSAGTLEQLGAIRVAEVTYHWRMVYDPTHLTVSILPEKTQQHSIDVYVKLCDGNYILLCYSLKYV